MKNLLLIILSAVFIFACNSNKDKELFESASELYKANNFTAAVTEYEKLINEYPSSEYAEDSYFALAGIYQMGKIQNLKHSESAKKAVDYYQRFYSKYSNSEKAPKALFMIGFIRANDLSDFDSARISYNEFLTKYPEHELAPSVKLELENLGKTPEQIISQGKAAAN